jgi:FlgN protein
MPHRLVTSANSTSHADPAVPVKTPDPGGDDAWAALTTILWSERELLEHLLFKLGEVQLIVTSGSTSWLSKADEEVQVALFAVSDTEVMRATEVEELTRRCGNGADVTLRELIAIAPSPWDALLADHCDALRGLALRIDAAANENRRRLQAGLDATRETLERVRSIRTTYNARGEALAQRPGSYLLDQQA